MEINCGVFAKQLWLAYIFGLKLDLQFTFIFSELLNWIQYNLMFMSDLSNLGDLNDLSAILAILWYLQVSELMIIALWCS